MSYQPLMVFDMYFVKKKGYWLPGQYVGKGNLVWVLVWVWVWEQVLGLGRFCLDYLGPRNVFHNE
jgi:hypothetical protein